MREAKLLLLVSILTVSLYGNNNFTIDHSLSVSSAYYFPDHRGYKLTGDITPIRYDVIEAENEIQRDIGSNWGAAELKITYRQSYSKDILTGVSFLTKDNKIKYTLIGEISPVSIEAGGEITLTPIAFLDIGFGSTIATGWKAIGVTGLGLNNIDNQLPKDSPFQGALSQSWLSGTFKFDTAAVSSGDKTWKHIIILSNHKLLYRKFSAAGELDPWIYQGSEGNKFNGFIYKHTSFLGYQMPLVIEKAGILLETESNLFDTKEMSTLSDGGWGSDFLKIRLGCLVNLQFSRHSSLSIIPQFTNAPRYTDSTNRELYFKNREANSDSPEYWDFERIALIYNYKF